MEFIPDSCWNAGIPSAPMMSCGRLRAASRLLNVPRTALAASLASLKSSNSASTFLVPLTFSSTRLASSSRPISTRLLGVSGKNSAPTKIAVAGPMASPSDSLHPHGWILSVK
ncbi:Os09g0322100 [Oryza sativa Japonica Group]|uniref:Os09g0322100 protein n=1 Tax=Oryza sativa subsp. japonica TaxID=39947 RepID=Q0J2N8_ORYSJ|nr:Os09g0322100 [Oryza sativa Japonica Group]|eukprot:NP_001062861.1 Os09g0322100 [Oryza sativa Japonica Group]